MSRETLIDLLYLFSATTFVLALKGLGSPKRARYGKTATPFGPVKFEVVAPQLQKAAAELWRRRAA